MLSQLSGRRAETARAEGEQRCGRDHAISSITMYSPKAKNRWRTGCRNAVWPCASTTESTKAEIADDPAPQADDEAQRHHLPRAPEAMSRTVGSMISATIFLEKKLLDVLISGPEWSSWCPARTAAQRKARLPTIRAATAAVTTPTRSRPGADSRKIESSQLLVRVRLKGATRGGARAWLRAVRHGLLEVPVGRAPARPGVRLAVGLAYFDDRVEFDQRLGARWRGAGRTATPHPRGASLAPGQQRRNGRIDQPW